MAANSIIHGKVYTINTTGFITSDLIVISGWYQTLHSTSGGATRAIIVDRATGKKVVGTKTPALVSFALGGIHLPAAGLSATVMSNSPSVTIYVE